MNDPLAENPRRSPVVIAVQIAVWLFALAIAALAAVNAFIAWRTPRIPPPPRGAFARYPGRSGDLAFVVHGSGPPLLLLHGLGAGDSMLEWADAIEVMSARHTVYAFDYLGWGLSDRPEWVHARDLVDQIVYFIQDIIATPCVVVAARQSGMAAVQAAAAAPALFTRLVLVCPGDGDAGTWADLEPPIELMPILQRLPVIGKAAYNWVVSLRAMDAYGARILYGGDVAAQRLFVREHWVSAHQWRSGFAPLLAEAELLELPWERSWSQLELPVLLVWGRYAGPHGFDTCPRWLALQPRARLQVIEQSILLPHVEQPKEFCRRLEQWLTQL